MTRPSAACGRRITGRSRTFTGNSKKFWHGMETAMTSRSDGTARQLLLHQPYTLAGLHRLRHPHHRRSGAVSHHYLWKVHGDSGAVYPSGDCHHRPRRVGRVSDQPVLPAAPGEPRRVRAVGGGVSFMPRRASARCRGASMCGCLSRRPSAGGLRSPPGRCRSQYSCPRPPGRVRR